MYAKPLAGLNTTAGVALLPDTGDNHVLFALALGLLASGAIIFAASLILSRKAAQN